MITNRIKIYLKYKDITVNSVEKELELGSGTLRKNISKYNSIGSNILEKFVLKYTDISMEWLLRGHGKMLL